MSEPQIQYATLRVTDSADWQDIECRFTDGQKFTAIQVDTEFPNLARQIVDALNAKFTAEREKELEKHIRALVMVVKNDVKWISDHGGAENPMSLAIAKQAEEALAEMANVR